MNTKVFYYPYGSILELLLMFVVMTDDTYLIVFASCIWNVSDATIFSWNPFVYYYFLFKLNRIRLIDRYVVFQLTKLIFFYLYMHLKKSYIHASVVVNISYFLSSCVTCYDVTIFRISNTWSFRKCVFECIIS